jgi:hypothetical protein
LGECGGHAEVVIVGLFLCKLFLAENGLADGLGVGLCVDAEGDQLVVGSEDGFVEKHGTLLELCVAMALLEKTGLGCLGLGCCKACR